MKLTQEQLDIIFSKKKKIKVSALAGSGKTTTLVEKAKMNSDLNILYLVFNKEMRKVSKHKFPINCEVHTINSFAFKYMKELIGKRKLVNKYTVQDIFNLLPESKQKNTKYEALHEAYSILESYNKIINSNIDIENYNGSFYENKAVLFYKKIIENKYDFDQNTLFKFFIDNYNFSTFNYDMLMIDKVQDTNPVTVNLIDKLDCEYVTLVGDSNQAIYGFRNNINIFNLDKFNSYEDFSLSKSFRFGYEISNLINDFSEKHFYKDLGMIGNEQIQSNILSEKDIVVGPFSAYITRTNSHLFDKAIEYALMDLNISLPFDWEETKDLIENIFYLKMGLINKVNHFLLKNFKSYYDFSNSIENGHDIELKYLYNLIEKHDLAIIEYVKLIENKLSSPKYADIVLITAHKAKGLEFLSVEVANDFIKLDKKHENQEEYNLIYVAMTRAIKDLKLNFTI